MSRLQSAVRGGDANGRPGWWIGFSYDLGMIEWLKLNIPYTDRVWDEERKLWWVAQEHEARILQMFPAFDAYLNQARLI